MEGHTSASSEAQPSIHWSVVGNVLIVFIGQSLSNVLIVFIGQSFSNVLIVFICFAAYVANLVISVFPRNFAKQNILFGIQQSHRKPHPSLFP